MHALICNVKSQDQALLSAPELLICFSHSLQHQNSRPDKARPDYPSSIPVLNSCRPLERMVGSLISRGRFDHSFLVYFGLKILVLRS